MTGIEAALSPVDELERDKSYAGNRKWAEIFGIQADLDFSMRELTMMSMKMAKPRKAIELMVEVLHVNIPIDALEAAQRQGRIAYPRYEVLAPMIWMQVSKQLSEPISTLKSIHENRELSHQSLLSQLVPMIMKALHMPTTASGLAVIFALMFAKMEFNAFSDEDDSIE